MIDLIIFAGTGDGRQLGISAAEIGINVLMCVATEYGAELVQSSDRLQVHTGRMDSDDMQRLFRAHSGCKLIVDATHPYAVEVGKNIKAAADLADCEYIRLIRGKSETESCISVPDINGAVEYLNKTGYRALLTVGSKELDAFTQVENYRERLFARVLPMVDVVEKCIQMGFAGRQLICMQGPFSHDINTAMIEMLSVDCLVTKDSGGAGGFDEKLSAAKQAGIKLVVIGRPVEESGLCHDEIIEILCRKFGKTARPKASATPRFPLFISLDGEKVVVIGGGKIATRRVKVLLKFGGTITVVAPEVSEEIESLAYEKKITVQRESYKSSHVQGAKLIVAATDSRDVNSRIAEDAQKLGIYASIADSAQQSSFYFPGTVLSGNLIAGIVSTDGDHKAVKQAVRSLRGKLEAEE